MIKEIARLDGKTYGKEFDKQVFEGGGGAEERDNMFQNGI